MQSFIVLGIIPGTNLQITFTLWVYLLAALMTYMSRHALLAACRTLRTTLIICRAAWAISGGDLTQPDAFSLYRRQA